MITSSFLEKPENITYSGEDKDEAILYVFRQSFIVNIPWMIVIVLMIFAPFVIWPFIPDYISAGFKFSASLFWYTVTFGYFIQHFFNWFFNVYIISDKKIVDVDFQGFLYKKISEAALSSVEDVTSTVKGAMGVLFNIGNVYIQTAAENREFEFDGVSDPSRIRDIISDLVANKKGHFHK